jgi:predicted Fe-Mo cluster-binding NifX family protein
MKIAVSSKGQSLDDALEASFGRCSGFVVYDTDSRNSLFVDNSKQQDSPQGAGIQAAQLLSSEGIDVLITGQIGPNAMQVLTQTQIKLYSSSAATVREAIESWQRNELTPITSSGCQPGSGQGSGGGGGARGRGPQGGGRGMGGGARGKGPMQGGQGLGGGGRGIGPGRGGRGMGGGGGGTSR